MSESNHHSKIKKGKTMNPLIQFKTIRSILVSCALACFALFPKAQAVVPAPDGGYPGGNTAEGQNALRSLTSGTFNTAVGVFSLLSNTEGNFNTAIGAGTLLSNTADTEDNTAIGAGALFANASGSRNTANGAFALFTNTEGAGNIANGDSALFSNTTGNGNTAVGTSALFANAEGTVNTAAGIGALVSNTTGNNNTAVGGSALDDNTTGENNTAIGNLAGSSQGTGSGNVYIGAGMHGIAGENNSCYIASIFGQTSASGIPVLINSNNKLGTTTSSKRFKEEIRSMDRASEALFSLKPVSFRYKEELDPTSSLQFGLVAEDVEKVNPALVVRDAKGQAYTVRYDQVNAMLLNEFLKEHKKVEEQQASIAQLKSTVAKQEGVFAQQQKNFRSATAQQQKRMEALTTKLEEQAAQIQKVSAQFQISKTALKTVSQ
jgi:hypothetical protein